MATGHGRWVSAVVTAGLTTAALLALPRGIAPAVDTPPSASTGTPFVLSDLPTASVLSGQVADPSELLPSPEGTTTSSGTTTPSSAATEAAAPSSAATEAAAPSSGVTEAAAPSSGVTEAAAPFPSGSAPASALTA